MDRLGGLKKDSKNKRSDSNTYSSLVDIFNHSSGLSLNRIVILFYLTFSYLIIIIRDFNKL